MESYIRGVRTLYQKEITAHPIAFQLNKGHPNNKVCISSECYKQSLHMFHFFFNHVADGLNCMLLLQFFFPH